MDTRSNIDLFLEDYARWRRMSGERRHTCETMDRVYGDLLRSYAHLASDSNDKDRMIMEDAIHSAGIEHQKRQEYRLSVIESCIESIKDCEKNNE